MVLSNITRKGYGFPQSCTIDANAERGITMQIRIDTLALNLVSGMFDIEVRYFDSSVEFHIVGGLTPDTLKRYYGDWTVSYITIEQGIMVIGIISPA